MTISKSAKFVLRFIAVQEDEIGRDGFTSLDMAEMLVAAGHDLDPRPTIDELMRRNFITLIERAEDTGGFNYYTLTQSGRALGYPEKYGRFDIGRITTLVSPIRFALTMIGVIGSPFAIASIFHGWVDWNTFALDLIETYRTVFREPVAAVLSAILSVVQIKNMPAWFADYTVLGIVFLQASTFSGRLEVEYSYWNDRQERSFTFVGRVLRQIAGVAIFVLLWPVLALSELPRIAVLAAYYLNLDGFDAQMKAIHPRLALTASVLGVFAPLLLFLVLWFFGTKP